MLSLPNNFYITGVTPDNYPAIATILDGHFWNNDVPINSPEGLKLAVKPQTTLGNIGTNNKWCRECRPYGGSTIIPAVAFIAQHTKPKRRL